MKKIRSRTPTKASVRRHLHQQELHQNHGGITSTTTRKSRKALRPIDAFGIVAAICAPSNNENTRSEGIIGVNGKLPWGSLPSDRKIFERLTRDRILIVGRRTLLNEREGNLDHVRHSKHCIVVSKSISSLKGDPRLFCNKVVDKDLGILKLARSLDEALDLARDLATELDSKNADAENRQSFKEIMDDVDSGIGDNNNDTKPIPSLLTSSGNIKCWVAGGERLYGEALQHQSALEVHLSVVDVNIDLTSKGVKHVAMFPAKNQWGQNYKLFSKTSFPVESKTKAKQNQKLQESFAYHIYKRIV